MSVSKDEFLEKIIGYSDSNFSISLTQEMIKNIEFNNKQILIDIEIGFPVESKHSDIQREIVSFAEGLFDDKEIIVDIKTNIFAHLTQVGTQLIPGVKNVIAIASGKGGVGKSTTTVNLALALSSEGANVGILDADIYGPSIPTMLGINDKPESIDGKSFVPLKRYNIQANSIGFLIPKDQAMVWRGPMVTQALEQLLRQTAWENLDYLLIDLPPGTGDIHLTLAQKVPITGAIIITTPQEISILDARKGLKMFEKVSVPILGVIENMGVYVCPKCGNEDSVFGDGGGLKLCHENSTHFFGSIPLNTNMREDLDSGNPTVISNPKGPVSQAFFRMATELGIEVANMKKNMSGKFPKIVVKK